MYFLLKSGPESVQKSPLFLSTFPFFDDERAGIPRSYISCATMKYFIPCWKTRGPHLAYAAH